jgi:hypothetical protein
MITSSKMLWLALLCAALLLQTKAGAEVPRTMNYQVMLTDDADQPLADQPVQLVFRIFGQESGGGELWAEVHNVTTNSIGVASVVLGSALPLEIDFSVPLWLQVEADGEVLLPRRPLTSAPYVLHDEVGGAGDGHSLDASDGDPVDAVYVDADGNVGVGTTSPEAQLHVEGELQLGSASTPGGMTIYGGAGQGRTNFDRYGNIEVVNEALNQVAVLGPTGGGSGGGKLWLSKDPTGYSGIWLDGNYLGTNAGAAVIRGADSGHSVYFFTYEDGTDCVQLPDDAIDSDEILDEPGVASLVYGAGGLITSSAVSLGIRSISAPSDGYIFAIATVRVAVNHDGPSTNTSLSFWLTDAYPNHSDDQTVDVMIPGAAGDGQYIQTVTLQGVFSATGGLTKTFRMYAQKTSGLLNSYCTDVHITLLFIPTSRGTINLIDYSAASAGGSVIDTAP